MSQDVKDRIFEHLLGARLVNVSKAFGTFRLDFDNGKSIKTRDLSELSVVDRRQDRELFSTKEAKELRRKCNELIQSGFQGMSGYEHIAISYSMSETSHRTPRVAKKYKSKGQEVPMPSYVMSNKAGKQDLDIENQKTLTEMDWSVPNEYKSQPQPRTYSVFLRYLDNELASPCQVVASSMAGALKTWAEEYQFDDKYLDIQGAKYHGIPINVYCTGRFIWDFSKSHFNSVFSGIFEQRKIGIDKPSYYTVCYIKDGVEVLKTTVKAISAFEAKLMWGAINNIGNTPLWIYSDKYELYDFCIKKEE